MLTRMRFPATGASAVRRGLVPLQSMVAQRWRTTTTATTSTPTTTPSTRAQPDDSAPAASAAVTVISAANSALSPATPSPSAVPSAPAPAVHWTPGHWTSDAPRELHAGGPHKQRRVRIYRPVRNPMQQSSQWDCELWQVDFDPQDRWENPLMGWVSSADAVQALRIKFNSCQQAVRFAEKQGWDYIIQEEHRPLLKRKAYANNFRYQADKLRLVTTK